MKLVSKGVSCFGDYESLLYRCKNGNYCVFIKRVDNKKEKIDLGNGLIVSTPRLEWLEGLDWQIWNRIHKLGPYKPRV